MCINYPGVIFGCTRGIGNLHVYLNFKPIKNYLNNRGVLVFGTLMSVLLLVLLIAGLNKEVDPDVAEQVQLLMDPLCTVGQSASAVVMMMGFTF